MPAHAYGRHEIAENVILCGPKLKERHPWISVIIMGILPAAESFRELDEWERSFLVNNQLCSPSPSDYQDNSNIADICTKTSIGKQLLRKGNISF